MNGPHDLGGRMGFGLVAPEQNEPWFHADWEERALGLTLCCGALGHWTLDESRHARESLHPGVYYAASYYEIWIRALETLLQRHGLLGDGSTSPHPRRLAPANVPAVLARGGPTDRVVTVAPQFAPGDRVRAKLRNVKTHTRLPAYLTGKAGVVEGEHGGFVLPDTNAHGLGEQPQRLYTVVFDGREVWGEGAEPGLTISADLWEGYLEHA